MRLSFNAAKILQSVSYFLLGMTLGAYIPRGEFKTELFMTAVTGFLISTFAIKNIAR